jgi:predicted  nucleic acid-binding Zn-ribbon protein
MSEATESERIARLEAQVDHIADSTAENSAKLDGIKEDIHQIRLEQMDEDESSDAAIQIGKKEGAGITIGIGSLITLITYLL